MMKSLHNFSKSLSIFIFTLFAVGVRAFAFDCSGYSAQIDEPKSLDSILYIVCPLQGAINIALYFVGAVLIILILYGAIKAVASVGDAKQLEGAKMTWSHAFFGFLIIILSLSIITILAKLLGSATPANVTDLIRDSLTTLYDDLRQ